MKYFVNDLGDVSLCSSYIRCFLTTIKNGFLNGGGIGDDLGILGVSQSKYNQRILYDVSFFLVINVIILNIIQGIIIDTFAEARDREREKQ